MDIVQKIATNPYFQKLVNTKKVSAFFGFLSNKKLPPFILRRIIRSFIKSNGIEMQDYDIDIHNIHTFNHFFTRKLKPNTRLFNAEICAPAEGFCSESGLIHNKSLWQVKGKPYLLNDLIPAAANFDSGSYLTIYLSPANYHRVHAPFDFQLQQVNYISGELYSLNLKNIALKDRLYCQNERIILKGHSVFGDFYLVLVGAIIVGKIKLNLFPHLPAGEHLEGLDIPIQQGDEVGLFELGSTVILIMDSEHLAKTEFQVHQSIRLGQALC